MNADATVVVGSANYGGPDPTHFSMDHAFRWTEAGGTVDIDGRDKNTTFSSANAVSADGTIVAGRMSVGTSSVFHAFRWTQATHMTDLGVIGGNGNSEALGISGNGNVLVGDSSVDNTFAVHAFRWTQAGGFQDLGTLANVGGDYDSSFAKDASYDGSVVVGWSKTAAATEHAFRWTQAGGMADLGTLPGDTYSRANAVSDDGSVIVGTSAPTTDYFYNGQVTGNEHAFRWTQATGMADLKTLLSTGGLNMKGISLLSADGLSPDGVAIVGQALMPGASTPSAYLVTYIDGTNYAVAKKEGLIDVINSTLSNGGGPGGGLTTTDSVQNSFNSLADSQQAATTHLSGTADTLLGFARPIMGNNQAGLFAGAGSFTTGVSGRWGSNGSTLLGGLAYTRQAYEAISVNHAMMGAVGLRHVWQNGRPVRPFVEGGGWYAPGVGLGFTRTYVNGAGTATGTGSTGGYAASLYARTGLVWTPTARSELAVAGTYQHGWLHSDAYSEASGTSNPFPASFAANTSQNNVAKVSVSYSQALTNHVDFTLAGAVGHAFTSGGVNGTVPGAGAVSGASGDFTFEEAGARIGIRQGSKVSLDGFVVATTGAKIGTHWDVGGGVRIRF